MPRIELDGEGDPIPIIALPPFGSDGNIPPVTLTFTDNADFSVSEYITLGFTHYEAWCVGAAGGRGGDSSNAYPYVGVDKYQSPVPQDVWNAHIAQIQATYGDTLYSWGADITMTYAQFEEYSNPNHLMTFTTWKPLLLFPMNIGLGGAGGGGGFQKVAGVLTDLPDAMPIVVGKAGSDASIGQVAQLGDWTPNPVSNPYLESYPPPNPTYGNPQPGGDGGASTFGEVCQASGGQGGAAGMIWDGAKFVVSGKGGDGGLGGTIIAGGGGAGSTAEGVNGADGVWHPETGIGGGGGGGKAGTPDTSASYVPGLGYGGVPPVTHHYATAGGQGSYSFGDTSVYGQRQPRQVWSPVNAQYINGAVVFVPLAGFELLIPGGGGGARPLSNLKIGSKATGYSPDGIVALRLTRITS